MAKGISAALWDNFKLFIPNFRGFSTIDLVENTFSKKQFALKRITCHSVEDQKAALQEIEYYKILRHPNVIELIESTFKGTLTNS